MNIRIITDSAADVAANYRDRIRMVPLIVSFGDEEYLDGVNLTRDEFYKKLESGNVTPKTGQATPPAFEEVFSEVEAAGDAAIVITVSSALSGTYQSACIAAADHPNIRVVDSRSVTIGQGILAAYACLRVDELAGTPAGTAASDKNPGLNKGACLNEGACLNVSAGPNKGACLNEGAGLNVSTGLNEGAAHNDAAGIDISSLLDSLAEELTRMRDKICVLAMLDTLEYLKRGGRISKAAAFAGGMLNIKPVIEIRDGAVAILGKARGSKRANNFLNEQIARSGLDYALPVLLGYAGVSDGLLRQYITDSRALWEGKIDPLECAQIGTAVGTHAGPGTVAVAFFKAHS